VPTPTPTPPAIRATLLLDPERIVAGECATLSWQVVGAEAVFLQSNGNAEQPVPPSSALRVCPTAETLYTLRAVAAAQQERRTVILEVLAAATTPTPTTVPIPTAPPPPTPTPPAVAPSPSPTMPVSTPTAAVVTVPATPTPGAVSIQPVPVFTPASPTSTAGNPARLFLQLGAFALVLAGLLGAGAWALWRQRRE
jgi:hypothetical protein